MLHALTPKAVCALCVGALLSAAPPVWNAKGPWEGAKERLSFVVVPLLLALSIMALASGAYNPFIYFRF